MSHELHVSFSDEGPDIFLGRLVVCNTLAMYTYTNNVFTESPIQPKGQERQSLRTELSCFVATPAVSTASSAAAHAGLSSTSRPPASPPSSRVASPTSSPSYTTSPLSRLGLSRLASIAPTPPMRSVSVDMPRIRLVYGYG